MEYKHQKQATRSWTTRRDEKKRRMKLVSSWMCGPLLPREKMVESLEALIAPADRIVLEGDNQKQADFLSRSLAKVDPEKLHDLHLVISSISRPEHLTLFELGIAKKVDFAFAGPQSLRVAQLLSTTGSALILRPSNCFFRPMENRLGCAERSASTGHSTLIQP